MEGLVWALGDRAGSTVNGSGCQASVLGRQKGVEGQGNRITREPYPAPLRILMPAVRLPHGLMVSGWSGIMFQEEPIEMIFNTFEGWMSLRGCQLEGRLNGEKKNTTF